MQLLITAAHSLGYGGCWMSAPVVAAEGLERVLGVEPPAQLVALVPVGRPAGAAEALRAAAARRDPQLPLERRGLCSVGRYPVTNGQSENIG